MMMLKDEPEARLLCTLIYDGMTITIAVSVMPGLWPEALSCPKVYRHRASVCLDV